MAAALGLGALLAACGPQATVPPPVRRDAPVQTTVAAPPAGCADRDLTPIEGFGKVAFRVTRPDGSVFDGCAHLAATPEARAQGLMGQPSLQGYDAMVFRYPGPSTSGFYMFRTTLPLSIAFVAADGHLVSTADMDPCPEADGSACPITHAEAPFVHAIEVGRGDLTRLGIVAGATVTFGEGGPAS